MRAILASTYLLFASAVCSAVLLSSCANAHLNAVSQPPAGSAHLAVSDTYNGRVLIFDAPFVTGEHASIVLGQIGNGPPEQAPEGPSTLLGPDGLSTDPAGNLYVSDIWGARLVQFTPPFANGMNASLEIGAASFSASGTPTPYSCLAGLPPTELCFPADATPDLAGNLWVADSYHGRVVEYLAPIVQGEAAAVAIGQADFDSFGDCNEGSTLSNWDPNYPSSASAASLCLPLSVAFDKEGNLWVADTGNDRVLEYSAPFSTGMAASLEIGYPVAIGMNSPFSTICFGSTAVGLCSPAQIRFDATGNLLVADSDNSRVLEFAPPFSSGMAATLVIGQPDFAHHTVLPAAANTLSFPRGISFDANGNLIVADSGNSRALIYVPPFANGMSASVVLGQPNMTTSTPHGCNLSCRDPSVSTMYLPGGALAF